MNTRTGELLKALEDIDSLFEKYHGGPAQSQALCETIKGIVSKALSAQPVNEGVEKAAEEIKIVIESNSDWFKSKAFGDGRFISNDAIEIVCSTIAGWQSQQSAGIDEWLNWFEGYISKMIMDYNNPNATLAIIATLRTKLNVPAKLPDYSPNQDAGIEEDQEALWVSVEDKLPREKELVLCYSEKRGIVADFFDDYVDADGKPRFNGTRDEWDYSVTHWMPLPKEPKSITKK